MWRGSLRDFSAEVHRIGSRCSSLLPRLDSYGRGTVPLLLVVPPGEAEIGWRAVLRKIEDLILISSLQKSRRAGQREGACRNSPFFFNKFPVLREFARRIRDGSSLTSRSGW